MIGKVVLDNQNAFVGGRQILDVALIEDEAIDLRKRNFRSILVCELDIEKAYDHVAWKFLFSIMEKMDFGPKRRKWIPFCISTIRVLVLVNDTPTDFFQTSRGLQ